MEPILIDIPMPIRTKRLVLRPPQAGDGPPLNEAVRESFSELAPWIPWATAIPTVEESEANARRAHAQWILREDLRLQILDHAGAFVGGTGLHRIDWKVRRFEIGYWVRTSRAGQGLVTESTAALASFAFSVLGARRLEIRCDPENVKSSAVPKKLGFRLEAHLEKDSVRPGTSELRDTLVFVRFDADGLP